jgi:hypothetical protein
MDPPVSPTSFSYSSSSSLFYFSIPPLFFSLPLFLALPRHLCPSSRPYRRSAAQRPTHGQGKRAVDLTQGGRDWHRRHQLPHLHHLLSSPLSGQRGGPAAAGWVLLLVLRMWLRRGDGRTRSVTAAYVGAVLPAAAVPNHRLHQLRPSSSSVFADLRYPLRSTRVST